MFHVAVCDDVKEICNEMEIFLSDYIECGTIRFRSFYSGESLYNSILSGEKFDLIFLDIELTELNGVMVGKKIREELKNEKVHVVFISSKQKYAMELFSIRPLNFLVKPYTKTQVIDALEKAMELTETYQKYFEFKFKQAYHRVFYKDILYFESDARKILIHAENENYEFYGKLDSIEKRLQDQFVRIHKSYLINRLHIDKYQYDEVLLDDGKTLPISKKYKNVVRKNLLKKWEKA